MMRSHSSDNFLCHYNIKILNLFDPGSQLINTKPMIKSKLKELLSESESIRKEIIIKSSIQVLK